MYANSLEHYDPLHFWHYVHKHLDHKSGNKKIGRNAERKVFTVPPQQEGDTLRAVWSSESQGDAAQGVERSSRLLFRLPACLCDIKSL